MNLCPHGEEFMKSLQPRIERAKRATKDFYEKHGFVPGASAMEDRT